MTLPSNETRRPEICSKPFFPLKIPKKSPTLRTQKYSSADTRYITKCVEPLYMLSLTTNNTVRQFSDTPILIFLHRRTCSKSGYLFLPPPLSTLLEPCAATLTTCRPPGLTKWLPIPLITPSNQLICRHRSRPTATRR